MNGTLRIQDGRLVLRYERQLRHSPEKVWRALTEPGELEHWFPTDIRGPRELGAALEFSFRNGEGPTLPGTITELDEPRKLTYLWGNERLCFELEKATGGCLLVFTVSFDERAKAPRDAAGWHLCLDGLEAALTNESPAIFSKERWSELYEGYLASIGAGDFPAFMKQPQNRIASLSEHTPGVEGYVFDGADGSQMAFWIAREDATTAEHVHEFDEYLLVVEGAYFLRINGHEQRIDAGREFHIPRGARIAGRVTAGTRTIHAFGGPRAKRASS